MKISIPKPCNENWNEMTPEQQGAFCKVCSKVVVDFSSMSDEEVISYFEKNREEKTCGRFRLSQLSPYELKINLRSVVAQKSFRKIFAASLFLFFSSLFVCKSDTGETMMFNVVATDTTIGKTVIMGGITAPVIEKADTSTLLKDTIVTPMLLGEPVVPVYPKIMGKVVCPRTIENKPPTKRPVETKKGEVRVMRLLKY